MRNLVEDPILRTFDKIVNEFSLKNEVLRRALFFIIYDFYMNVLWNSKDSIDLNEEMKINDGLKNRWRLVLASLSRIIGKNESKKWNRLIISLFSTRNSVTHSDKVPTEAKLLEFRKEAKEFDKWIKWSGMKYSALQGTSTNIHLMKKYLILYNILAEIIISRYGSELPFISKKLDDTSIDILIRYEELKKIITHIKEKTIITDSVTLQEITILPELSQFISSFHIIESLLILDYICPNCGGKLIEKLRPGSEIFLGAEDDQELKLEKFETLSCDKCVWWIRWSDFDCCSISSYIEKIVREELSNLHMGLLESLNS